MVHRQSPLGPVPDVSGNDPPPGTRPVVRQLGEEGSAREAGRCPGNPELWPVTMRLSIWPRTPGMALDFPACGHPNCDTLSRDPPDGAKGISREVRDHRPQVL